MIYFFKLLHHYTIYMVLYIPKITMHSLNAYLVTSLSIQSTGTIFDSSLYTVVQYNLRNQSILIIYECYYLLGGV